MCSNVSKWQILAWSGHGWGDVQVLWQGSQGGGSGHEWGDGQVGWEWGWEGGQQGGISRSGKLYINCIFDGKFQNWNHSHFRGRGLGHHLRPGYVYARGKKQQSGCERRGGEQHGQVGWELSQQGGGWGGQVFLQEANFILLETAKDTICFPFSKGLASHRNSKTNFHFSW